MRIIYLVFSLGVFRCNLFHMEKKPFAPNLQTSGMHLHIVRMLEALHIVLGTGMAIRTHMAMGVIILAPLFPALCPVVFFGQYLAQEPCIPQRLLIVAELAPALAIMENNIPVGLPPQEILGVTMCCHPYLTTSVAPVNFIHTALLATKKRTIGPTRYSTVACWKTRI